jgi:hypothetical protein
VEEFNLMLLNYRVFYLPKKSNPYEIHIPVNP